MARVEELVALVVLWWARKAVAPVVVWRRVILRFAWAVDAGGVRLRAWWCECEKGTYWTFCRMFVLEIEVEVEGVAED